MKASVAASGVTASAAAETISCRRFRPAAFTGVLPFFFIPRHYRLPAGLNYEFDMGGEPLAVLYLEPGLAGAEQLASFVRKRREMRGGLVGDAGEISLLREIYEERDSSAWIGHALDDLVGFATHEPCQIDPRVIRIIDVLRERYADMRRVVSVAEAIGLSASRFQHVFTQQVGVPFRRYRAWCRMRAAISEVVGGSNLTTASHAAGFADQAHFSREFRRTFGAPATPSLAKIRAVTTRPSTAPKRMNRWRSRGSPT